VKEPTVIGPIPSTATNYPFAVEGFDVQPPVPKGDVVEEYFFSGKGGPVRVHADGDPARHAMPGSSGCPGLYWHPVHDAHDREAPGQPQSIQRHRDRRAAQSERRLRHRRVFGVLTPAPEPSVTILLMSGLSGLMLRVRRRSLPAGARSALTTTVRSHAGVKGGRR
jgi:hypothetical protein